jgi:hypothetical protein
MRAALTVLLAALALAVGLDGCLTEPVRSFYDDLDASGNMARLDGSSGSDGTADAAGADGSAADATTDSPDVFSDGNSDSGASDASNERMNDTGIESGPEGGNEGGADGGDAAVDGAGDSGVDAASEAEAGCGPTNTIANCGACGAACDTAQSVGGSCNGVSCAYSGCAPGYGDCVTTGPPNTDGCETRLNTTANCTGCMLACESSHSLGASCNGTTCAYSGCAPGYADCFAAAPDIDGCETQVNTITRCTGCNTRCDVTHSLGASCGVGGCAYTGCVPGWTSCNMAPPNAQGCACNTPGCCGSNCQTTHADGLGDSFYDCQPLGTHTQAQATAACAAFTGNVAECSVFTCTDATMGPLICSDLSATTCACWSYGGGNVGRVFDAMSPGAASCACPLTTDQSWN